MQRGKNPKYITQLARSLRREQTVPERILWKYLRNRRLNGYKFKRQYPIGRYILDFYCPERNLGVEIDGRVHSGEDRVDYDRKRDQLLQGCGVRIVRIPAAEVLNNITRVLLKIESGCKGIM